MKISVVIPCYNAEPFLKETLQSALNQTLPPLEMIVIDDGSTDDSAAIAESFGPPVLVIRQENQGESVARNRGIAEAKGDWVALLDADDFWRPTKLEKHQQAWFSLSSDYVCSFDGIFRFGANIDEQKLPLREPGDDNRSGIDILCDGGFIPSTTVIRKDAAERIQFPTDISVNEDLLFFVGLKSLGRFFCINEHLTGWRVSSSQQSRRSDYEYEACLTRLKWLKNHEVTLSSEDCNRVRRSISKRLEIAHENAFWARDLQTVRNCRVLFECEFNEYGTPSCFERRLWPQLAYKIKDKILG